MYRFVILCFLLFALKEARGQTTEVNQCIRSNGILPINAYVEGCYQQPCVLPQLEDAVIHVVFKAPHVLYNMTTRALARVNIILPIEINYPLGPDGITCNFLTNTYCPILKDEIVQYTLRMHIETTFTAGLTPTIEFSVNDANGQPVWCIRVQLRITPPRTVANIN